MQYMINNYNIMKEPQRPTVTITFTPKIRNLIISMSERYAMSRSKIISEAVAMYAEKKAKEVGSLMSFAGSIKDDQGKEILEIIKKYRINKEEIIQ